MKARDERVDRARARAPSGVPVWRMPPVDDDADAVCERRRVLEVVRDEERRQARASGGSPAARRGPPPRVRVECGQRLVEQEHGRVARERAGERDPLPLAARQLAHPRSREVTDPEPLEQLVDPRLARAEPTLADDVEVREERVLLEEVADAALLRRDVDSADRCRAARSPPSARRPRLGRRSPATTRRTRRLPRAGRARRARASRPRSTVSSADATSCEGGE